LLFTQQRVAAPVVPRSRRAAGETI